MNDKLSASWVLIVGSVFLAYYYWRTKSGGKTGVISPSHQVSRQPGAPPILGRPTALDRLLAFAGLNKLRVVDNDPGLSTGQYSLGPSGTGWATSFTQLTTTVAAVAGASTITVSSATGLSSGDNIGIVLNSLAIQWTTINGAPAGNVVTLTATLTGAVASGNVVYTYPTTSQARRPLEIVTVSIRDQDKNDVPIYKMTVQEYEALPTKVQTASPTDITGVYYEAQLTNGILYTDAPAAADCRKYLHIVYLSPIEDFDAATDTPDYPQEWYLALVAGLAVNIAPAFQLPVTQDMKASFISALTIAQQSNPETTALFFQKGEDGYAAWGNF
jgi:hypothetical protein